MCVVEMYLNKKIKQVNLKMKQVFSKITQVNQKITQVNPEKIPSFHRGGIFSYVL